MCKDVAASPLPVQPRDREPKLVHPRQNRPSRPATGAPASISGSLDRAITRTTAQSSHTEPAEHSNLKDYSQATDPTTTTTVSPGSRQSRLSPSSLLPEQFRPHSSQRRHYWSHERGEVSGTPPIRLDTSASAGLRHTRGRPPRGARLAFVLRRNSTVARQETPFARWLSHNKSRCCPVTIARPGRCGPTSRKAVSQQSTPSLDSIDLRRERAVVTSTQRNAGCRGLRDSHRGKRA